MAKKAKSKRLYYGFGAIYIRETKSGVPKFYCDYRDRKGDRVQKLIRNATCMQDEYEWLVNAVLLEHRLECGHETKKDIGFVEYSEVYIQGGITLVFKTSVGL